MRPRESRRLHHQKDSTRPCPRYYALTVARACQNVAGLGAQVQLALSFAVEAQVQPPVHVSQCPERELHGGGDSASVCSTTPPATINRTPRFTRAARAGAGEGGGTYSDASAERLPTGVKCEASAPSISRRTTRSAAQVTLRQPSKQGSLLSFQAERLNRALRCRATSATPAQITRATS